jgi:hypothetical protein
MSDAVVATVVTAAGAFAGAVLGVVGLWLAGRQRLEELRIANELAAVKVETVRTTLAENTEVADRKLDGIAAVSVATHTLVNSNMGVQLKLNAVVTRRLAAVTNDPEDLKAADLSERLLREHEAKQAVVDSRPDAKTPATPI